MHTLLHEPHACRCYTIIQYHGIMDRKEDFLSRGSKDIPLLGINSVLEYIRDRRYYASLKWTGLCSSSDDGGIDSREKVPRGENSQCRWRREDGRVPSRKREPRDCTRRGFLSPSRLIYLSRPNSTSRRKYDKPAACDTSRKIECVCVMRTVGICGRRVRAREEKR